MDWLTQPEAWVALATLTALEIVLGIDNIVFISILTDRLPEHQRSKARKIGLFLAMAMRILLLSLLSWIMSLQKTLFTVLGHDISGKGLILIVGGLFLLAKSTKEIHHKLEGDDDDVTISRQTISFGAVIGQIALLDMVFSIDSVITAVGMASEFFAVMIIAVVISVIVMVLFVNVICDFVERHPTFKMLALSFLLLIGVALIGEGLGLHIPKGYIYFAMAFSFFVEMLNIRSTSKIKPVKLRGPDLD